MNVASHYNVAHAHIATSVTREGLLVGVLTGVFVLSFIPYITVVDTATLLAGPLALILTASFGVAVICPKRFRCSVSALRRPRVLLLALALPIFPMVIAGYGSDATSLLYAVLMSATLMAAQMVLAALGIEKIIAALASAGAIAVPLFVLRDWSLISHAMATGSRLIPSAAQPNAIAFIFAGFVIAWTWAYLKRHNGAFSRVWYAMCGIFALLVIMLASSRASVLALLCAGIWLVSMHIYKSLRHHSVPRYFVVVVFFVVSAIAVLAVVNLPFLTRIPSAVSSFFELESSYRGLGSGFSGRTLRWNTAMHAIMEGGVWLFGAGYRTSGAALGFSIDNGYITVWYECGLFGLVLITGQMLWLLFRGGGVFLNTKRQLSESATPLVIGIFIVALLFNSIFDRYLFGLGNPFSLFALFLMLLSRADLGLQTPAKRLRAARITMLRSRHRPIRA